MNSMGGLVDGLRSRTLPLNYSRVLVALAVNKPLFSHFFNESVMAIGHCYYSSPLIST